MNKLAAIAFKDLISALRSSSALIFMFGIPLMFTGLFYLMFGRIAESGDFNLPRVAVVVANLDEGRPRQRFNADSLPEGVRADSMGELVTEILASDDLAELLAVTRAADAAAARAEVDERRAQAAVIIPPDFTSQFADPDGQATLELYHDPTLTVGPAIVRAVLSRFIDIIAGVKIVVDQAVDAVESGAPPASAATVVAAYMEDGRGQSGEAAEFLEVRPPPGRTETDNPILAIVTPIMIGMMIFYAFYTAVSTAATILVEDEQRTLPRLFTTPTPRGVILGGKFLAVFLTVLVQVFTLIVAARLIFGIRWGPPGAMIVAGLGIVTIAATCGIFINSLLKSTNNSGMIFGGLMTITGMLGMIRVFAMNSPQAVRLGDSVGLIAPQGWAVRLMLDAVYGATAGRTAVNLGVVALLSLAFFGLGVWRFRKRYG